MPASNACQLVFKYLLMNPHLFVKAFHNRVYAYSSGSKFLEVSGKLAEWIESNQKTLDAYDSAEEEVLYCHILTRMATY